MNNRPENYLILTGLLLNLGMFYGFGIPSEIIPFRIDLQRIGLFIIVLGGIIAIFRINIKEIKNFIDIRVVIFYLINLIIFFSVLTYNILVKKNGIIFSFIEILVYCIVPISILIGAKRIDRNALYGVFLFIFFIITTVNILELMSEKSVIDISYRNLIENVESVGFSKWGGRIFKFSGGGGLQITPNNSASTLIFLSPLLLILIQKYKNHSWLLMGMYILAMIETETRSSILFLAIFILIAAVGKFISIKEISKTIAFVLIILLISIQFGNKISMQWLINHDHLHEIYNTNDLEVKNHTQLEKAKISRFLGFVLNSKNIVTDYQMGYGPLGTDKLSDINTGFIDYNDPGFNLLIFFEYGLLTFFILFNFIYFIYYEFSKGSIYIKYFCILLFSIVLINMIIQIRNAHTWLYFSFPLFIILMKEELNNLR